MEKDKKFRALAIAAICIAIVGVSVAYAAISTVLNISGSATVNTADAWKIVFTNVPSSLTTTGGASQVGTIEHDTGTSTITWGASFTAPGDSVSFTTKVANTGTIDAVLSAVTKSVDGDAADYFTYDVQVGNATIATGSTLPETYRLLNAAGTAEVTVTVTFDKDKKLSADTLASLNTKQATFALVLEFAQASSTDKGTYSAL